MFLRFSLLKTTSSQECYVADEIILPENNDLVKIDYRVHYFGGVPCSHSGGRGDWVEGGRPNLQRVPEVILDCC